ncbi:MAG: hypothetical protein OEW30_21520, partial [Acidimicrobiia bacterium]|nr:hypothetical protein [Acidimicrobiia bacterium]
LIVVRGEGDEAVATEVGPTGTVSNLDLLTDGAPRSLVVTPGGSTLVFSTTVDEAAVYTLPVGSQGPATPFALGVEGLIDHLDTDGGWVAGTVGDNSFLLDLSTGAVFLGPPGVRFSFDRTERVYLDPETAAFVEGTFFGYVVDASDSEIVFDEAEFLTGDDAAAAAEAAGEESPPPNDFFIRNTTDRTITLRLAPAVEVFVQAGFPEAGVGAERITLDEWLGLRRGEPLDFDWYGAGALPYSITVKNGRITVIDEVYLP